MNSQQQYEDEGEIGFQENPQSQELLTIQLDVDSVLKKFEHEVLRGRVEVKDDNGMKRYSPICGAETMKPMNELGVREILARIKGKVTTIAKLSYKTDKEVYMDMFYFDNSIIELFAKRSDAWEMDMEIAKSIKDAALDLVWDLVASSREGFTAINLRSQYSKHDVSRTDGTQTKDRKTFLGIPLGGK